MFMALKYSIMLVSKENDNIITDFINLTTMSDVLYFKIAQSVNASGMNNLLSQLVSVQLLCKKLYLHVEKGKKK